MIYGHFIRDLLIIVFGAVGLIVAAWIFDKIVAAMIWTSFMYGRVSTEPVVVVLDEPDQASDTPFRMPKD